MEKLKFLENALKSINCETDNNKIEQILKFFEMLIEKNKVMNLTAITDFEEFVSKHIVDSLSV